jgi:hypothetical protein
MNDTEAQQIFEELTFGFRLDANLRLDAEATRRFVPSCDESCSSASRPIERVAARAATAATHAALELSAGVDSRFVAALAVMGGVVPRRAITIHTSELEVEVAKRVADALQLEHRIVHPVRDVSPERLAADAREFVVASAGLANASAYAMLPGIFRDLSPFRTAQFGGVGGEIASGFYWSPLDHLAPFVPCGTWARLRLAAPGLPASRLYRASSWRQLWKRSIRRLSDIVRTRAGEGRRDALDRLYREQRLGAWAIPVLNASASWYQPQMPLLCEEFFQWAAEQRGQGRRSQIELIRAVSPNLARIGFNALPREAGGGLSSRANKIVTKAQRAFGRVLGKDRAPPPHLIRTTERLLQCASIHGEVEALVRENDALGLDIDAVRRALDSPAVFAFEIGSLITAAIRRGEEAPMSAREPTELRAQS